MGQRVGTSEIVSVTDGFPKNVIRILSKGGRKAQVLMKKWCNECGDDASALAFYFKRFPEFRQ